MVWPTPFSHVGLGYEQPSFCWKRYRKAVAGLAGLGVLRRRPWRTTAFRHTPTQ